MSKQEQCAVLLDTGDMSCFDYLCKPCQAYDMALHAKLLAYEKIMGEVACDLAMHGDKESMRLAAAIREALDCA